ncbi:MAG TPA: hypothetical protein VLF94_03560 [Chlamydiales bacterium]|nr:hypothetical protein [Chlamydiales bacterium]
MSSQTEINSTHGARVKEVLYSYGKFFICAVILAVVATSGALSVNYYWPLPSAAIRVLQILGAIIEVTALGNMGWELQTWNGNTLAERINSKLARCFSLVGFSVLVFSLQLIELSESQVQP